MTSKELRDWHATRDRWERWSETVWRREVPGNREYEYRDSHPFPPTLDAADASFPNWWDWWVRLFGDRAWFAGHKTPDLRIPDKPKIELPYTGDKIHDLYALSKLAWEQEATK